MADSLNNTSSEYINVNSGTKPDTSTINKNLFFNKDNINQNTVFEKNSSSDKFKNSALFPDKKLLHTPKGSPVPQRVPISVKQTKVINSPSSTLENVKSPSPLKEEKIINSPLSSRSSPVSSQEFRLVNPTSRSASISSQVDSSIYNSQDFIIPKSKPRSVSDNDSDVEILELLSDEEKEQPSADVAVLQDHEDDVFTDNHIDALESASLASTSSGSENKENEASILNFSNMANDLFDETILELQMIESEGFLGEKNENDNGKHNSSSTMHSRSSIESDSDNVLCGLLDVTDMADNDIG